VCTGNFIGPDCCEVGPRTCDEIATYTTAVNCSTCTFYTELLGLDCTWCAVNLSQAAVLTDGSCVSPITCGVNFTFYQCPSFAPFVPPSCPDNCSSNGACVDIANCSTIDSDNYKNYGSDKNKWPLSCGSNYNYSVANNYNTTCACYPGHSGINCGDFINLGFIAALAGGIIAAIIIAAVIIVCGAMLGGSAAAISASNSHDTEGHVFSSPLYKGMTRGSDVQLV